MKKGAIIAIVIIVLVIVIGVVGYLIYSSNKKKKEQAAQQLQILQQQLAQNPNMPPAQKAGILEQIANLAAMVAAAKAGQGQNPPGYTPPYVPGYGMPPYANTPPSGPGTPVAPYGFPLKTGSSGDYVKSLQTAINAKCGKNLVADGKFGPLTQSAAQACIGYPTVSWDQYRTLVG